MHQWMAGQLAPMEPVAAGFVISVDGRLQCYGVSDGLKLASRPDRDSALVNRGLDEDGEKPV